MTEPADRPRADRSTTARTPTRNLRSGSMPEDHKDDFEDEAAQIAKRVLRRNRGY